MLGDVESSVPVPAATKHLSYKWMEHDDGLAEATAVLSLGQDSNLLYCVVCCLQQAVVLGL